MKIAHLVSSGGLFGAERVLLALAERQSISPDKAWVGAIRNVVNPHLEVVEEAKRRGLSSFVIESKGRFDLRAVKSFERFLRDNAIDIVHTHNYKANFVGLFAAKRAGVSIVATNHLWTGAGAKLRFYEMLDGLLLKFCFKKVVAVSQEIMKDMVRQGIEAKKIEVVQNGIGISASAPEAREAKQRFGLSGDSLVVGVVARLSPEKGHKYLFEALGKLDVKVLIVGDGPLRGSFRPMDNVIFTGYQSDMESVYAAIDILVQPSLREGLPMVLLEAMGRGKAVIATRVGGVPALVKDGETGLLVDATSSMQLAAALEKLVRDPSLRARLGYNAQKSVLENYSVEKMAASYRCVYEEVLKS